MSTTDTLKKKYTEMKLLESSAEQALNVAKLNEITAALSLAGVTPSISGYPAGSSIATALAADGDSSVYDFGDLGPVGNNERNYPVLVRLVSTVTAGSADFVVSGSVDGTTYTALKYADSATPTTFGTAATTINATGTVIWIIKPQQTWRYLKVTQSGTTITISTDIDVYPLGGNHPNVSVA